MALSVLDPYGGDRTAQVTIKVDGLEYANVESWSYESSILQLGDPCRVSLGAPDGKYAQLIEPGSTLKYYMADPDVDGGAKILKLTGIVTQTDIQSTPAGGTSLTVTGADLGWHLANNCGPLWFSLKQATWDRLLKACITPHEVFSGIADPNWGFAGVRFDNDGNRERKLNLGRAGVQQRLARVLGNPKSILPPIQIEPGQTLADLLTHYAKLSKCLVNVSADGYLQIFNPRYDQPSRYTIHHHASDEAERTKNNVLSARLSRGLADYTEVVCLSTITQPPKAENVDDPNRGSKRQTFRNRDALDFRRYWTFVDTEQLKDAQILARAEWFMDRAAFDAWTYEVTVSGVSQQGNFYEPDTMIEVDDTVFNVKGNYYVAAVRCNRDMNGGTTTTLTIKPPNLLEA